MCGISGIYSFDGRPVSQSTLSRMNSCLGHRGPDDSGVLVDDPIGLGHTRLSIIDLSAAGHQPIHNEDRTVWLVFNGEIYNFQQIRSELLKKGHNFISHTDSEVIVHAYEQYGFQGTLSLLRGMFAIALWDRKIRTLFLARDRIGKKPLKYYLDENQLLFASELKAILATNLIETEVDYEAIDSFLTYQYVPTPKTGFKKIWKLPPAHYLECRDGDVKIRRYWGLDYSQESRLSEGDWTERILQKLDESVKIRMVSDVSLGAFLSGGVDSSAVVSSMALQSTGTINTFSIGFSEEKHNELHYARLVADQYATNHTELIVEAHDFTILPELVYCYEEPYADSSAMPSFLLSKLTKQHVTVVLNGDGGDENFAGYPWYRRVRVASRLGLLEAPARLVRPLVSAIHRSAPSGKTRKLLTFIDALKAPKEARHILWLAYFNQYEKQHLYDERFLDLVRSNSLLPPQLPDQKTPDPLSHALHIDISGYLPDDLLAKIDIASMAFGLEARSPLLDQEFVQMAAAIPSNLKLNKGVSKYILKKALVKRLPPEIIYRDKRGFSIPIDNWFRNELHEWSKEILMDPRTLSRGLFRKEGISDLLLQHKTGRVNHGLRIWALIMLELWFRRFVDEGGILSVTCKSQ